jgi:hypothetical protein
MIFLSRHCGAARRLPFVSYWRTCNEPSTRSRSAGSAGWPSARQKLAWNHPDMASAPLRAAFFDRPAIARADRKLHCAEIARLAEVTPVVAFPRHLVHVGKVLAQIAVAAVMLGANFGTTLIVQVLSFDVSRVSFLFILIGVFMFRRSGVTRTRDLGRVGIGKWIRAIGAP